MRLGLRLFAALLVLGAGACAKAQVPPPAPPPPPPEVVAGAVCRSDGASLHFDIAGAPPSACAVTGVRAFTVLVTPEHAPPINPSPWYAFRFEGADGAPATVTLRYLGGEHRYAPKWNDGSGTWRDLSAEPTADDAGVVVQLPAGRGVIAAQEIITQDDASADLARWRALTGAEVFTLGTSRDGRPITAIRLGRADASRLVVLLGRQHPPEVTGAMAMQAFVDGLAERAGKLGDIQVLVVPMLNPDGVARGHWRANRGAVDLNRDWGSFTQPETSAVKAWLDALPPSVRPVLMVDFHSTRTNLFYVQGPDETSADQQRFLNEWLGGQENALAGYPFTLEPRNANPGSGTAKNWFNTAYEIPAYTYEVADTADRAATRAAARALAVRLLAVLGESE